MSITAAMAERTPMTVTRIIEPVPVPVTGNNGGIAVPLFMLVVSHVSFQLLLFTNKCALTSSPRASAVTASAATSVDVRHTRNAG